MTNGIEMTVKIDGKEYRGEYASITKTFLGREDHGIFTANLTMEGPGWGVGVGGYNLTNGGFASVHLLALMDAVGVPDWESLRGKEVIVLFDKEDYGRAVGLCHPLDPQRKNVILPELARNWNSQQKGETN